MNLFKHWIRWVNQLSWIKLTLLGISLGVGLRIIVDYGFVELMNLWMNSPESVPSESVPMEPSRTFSPCKEKNLMCNHTVIVMEVKP